MSKYGEFDVYTQNSGWITIEVGDPSVMDYVPIEVYTQNNGWGAFNLVDPAEADTPFEVYTAAGWKGIKKKIYTLIDSMEDGDMAEYTDNNNVFNAQTETFAEHGSYVAHFSAGSGSNSACVSLEGNGLNYYPSRGDKMTQMVRLGADVNGAGIQFGAQEDRNTFPQGYRATVNHTNDGAIKIVHQDPPGTSGGTYTVASSTIDTTGLADSNLEFVVEWGSPTITATLYDSAGSQVGQASGDDSDFDSGGFGFTGSVDSNTGSDQHVYYDFARKTGTA